MLFLLRFITITPLGVVLFGCQAPRVQPEQSTPVTKVIAPRGQSPVSESPRPAPLEKPKKERSRLPATGGTLANPGIIESSGLARSLRRPDLLWTINDGDKTPLLYAVGTDGSDLGTWTIRGAKVRDWEGLASCVIGGLPHLLIGDFGDNLSQWSECRVIAVPEPSLDLPSSRTLEPTWTMRFRYPDGARNCEALAVDSQSGLIYLIDKQSKGGASIYTLPLGLGPNSGGSVTAKRVGPVGKASAIDGVSVIGFMKGVVLGEQVTGLDFNPTNDQAAVLTYGRALIFDRAPNQNWGAALQGNPRPQAHFGLLQPEGIAYSLAGDLYGTSEGKTDAPLRRIGE